MSKTVFDTGNHVAAYAIKMARAQVIAAYPITPQTTIVEQIAQFTASGEMQCQYIEIESEHSAMAACIGAAAVGARAFTATSSQGLVYMHEMLHWASSSRLPIVMAVVNRSLGPGWNIWADLTDSLSQRDTGWIQLYCQNNQEIFDTLIQAFKISEDKRVLLPVMVCFEGPILSHLSTPVKISDQKMVDKFIPLGQDYGWRLDVNNPITHGSIVFPEHYMEFRYAISKAMENAKRVIVEVDREYEKIFGITHGGLVEKYRCNDAKLILISMGSIAGEAQLAVDRLREKGHRIGLARIRAFRPFPTDEVKNLDSKVITVIDRAFSPGSTGILHSEVKSALFEKPEKNVVFGYIAGLGGRDVTFLDIEKIAKDALQKYEAKKITPKATWYGFMRRKKCQ